MEAKHFAHLAIGDYLVWKRPSPQRVFAVNGRDGAVTAVTLESGEIVKSEEAEGLYARALQHEYDHIEGTTIADRMGSAARIVHRKQLKKLREEHEEAAS